ncbi:MAG: hypothetical protein LBS50_00675 [Prevotellaceae bacterium]|jgi:phosphoglycolate phosphatase-like HAD superfamily hydrolase|nr:hypothetical protein [Prevotellaceae bacterium]
MIKHISFDFWQTLFCSNPIFRKKRAEFIKTYFNIDKSVSEIEQLIIEKDKIFDKQNEVEDTKLPALDMFQSIVENLNVLSKNIQQDAEKLLEASNQLFLENPPKLLNEQIPDILEKLVSSGITLSIGSNTGFVEGKTLRQLLQNLGILKYFSLHAEHSEGNNSTFSVRVTASAGTDIYSSISAGIASLKGNLHGEACVKCYEMFIYLKNTIRDWKDMDKIDACLIDILNGQAFDKSGLIYGIGHSIYADADPRAMILKKIAYNLANEKGRSDEFNFGELIGNRAIEQIKNKYGKQKIVSPNIDFYSGFIYEMIGLQKELYIALFAMSRIVGWCAHYIDEVTNNKKIIRPVSNSKPIEKQYIPINDRTINLQINNS